VVALAGCEHPWPCYGKPAIIFHTVYKKEKKMRQRKNSAQQRTRNASQLASTYRLGTLIGEYPKTRTPELIRTLSACGALLLALLLLFLPTAHGGIESPFVNPTTLPALSFFAGLVLLVPSFIYALVGSSYLFSGRVCAFTDGFIYFKRGKPEVFRWEDVKLILKTRIQGQYSFSSYTSVIRADGYSASLHIRGIGPFLSLLYVRVAAARKLKMQKAYEAGTVLTFGPLDVSLEGVNYQKRLLPWSDIDQIFLLSGTLHIRTAKEKQSDWATIPGAERIPNISLFIELTRDILAAKRPSL
jgi:hypothetical protein